MANSVTFSRLGAGIFALMGCVGIALAAPPVDHDFNNDGFEDFPVGRVGYDEVTPKTGAVRVWSGSDMTSLIDAIIPAEGNTLFGWSLGSAGDINADGSADLIVGQPLWSVNGSYSGRIRVFSGADETELLVVDGPYIDTGLGRYVAGVGDWNGDGVPDIAASGWDIADTDQDGIGDDPVGIVYIFSGADGSQLAEIFEPTASPMFGFAVFGLGDINGDGLADVAVVDRGAEGAPGTGAHGSISIFTGRAAAGALALTDAHAIILNNDPTLRGFGAHVDTMHPDLWLAEPTLQVISLTDADVGGPNAAPTRVDILALDGQVAGSKGIRQSLVLAGDINLDGAVNATDLQAPSACWAQTPRRWGRCPLST